MTNPVFRGISDEILLAATCCRVTFRRATACTHQVIESGELDNQSIVVVLPERFGTKPSREDRLEMPQGKFLSGRQLPASRIPRTSCTHVVLLDNLLKSSVIQLRKLCQVVYIRNNVAQVLFQQHEIFFGGRFEMSSLRAGTLLAGSVDDILHLLPRRGYPPPDLITLDMLECKDLVKLLFKLPDETLLIIFIPCSSLWVWILCSWLDFERCFKTGFELVVSNIGVVVIFN